MINIYDLIFIPLGTRVPNSLIHSDSRSFKASLFLLKTFSIGAISMCPELWPEIVFLHFYSSILFPDKH